MGQAHQLGTSCQCCLQTLLGTEVLPIWTACRVFSDIARTHEEVLPDLWARLPGLLRRGAFDGDQGAPSSHADDSAGSAVPSLEEGWSNLSDMREASYHRGRA